MDEKDRPKIEKKRAKSRAKAEKKLRKAQTDDTPSESLGRDIPTTAPVAHTRPQTELPPAERSARAAERNVRMTAYRVWIGAITLVVTIITATIAILHYARTSGTNAPVTQDAAVGVTAPTQPTSRPHDQSQ